MPCQTDEQPTVVAPVGWPPVLAVGHQRVNVCLNCLVIQGLHRVTMVIIHIHRVGPSAMLVQDVKV